MEKTLLNISEINNIISKAKETFVYEIWIPSLQKNVMFREISTGQQKRLIKAIIDSPIYNTEFIFALNNIIKENCAEPDIDINELTIYDKLFICLTMRIYSIGKDLTFIIKGPKTGVEYKQDVNLLEILEKLKELNLEINAKIYEVGPFKVTVNIPTIGEEYLIEKELRDNNINIDIKTDDEIRSALQNVFITELIKVIKKIEIKSEDKIIELDLKNLKYKDRVNLIEKLPIKLIKNVIEYIASYNNKLNEILILKFDIEGEIFEQKLRLDASFFTNF